MSKLIKCPACKKRIAFDAPTCPKCGHELTDEERDNGVNEEKKSRKGCLIFFLIVLAIGIVMEMTSKDKETSAPVAAMEQTQQPPQSEQHATAITTEQVRTEVASLLAELDGFRNTSTFKQCVYGCGQENPAKAWDVKRKALQAQMNPQLDVPILLKLAPGELWSLGMAYAKGRADEVKELRDGIEKALQQ